MFNSVLQLAGAALEFYLPVAHQLADGLFVDMPLFVARWECPIAITRQDVQLIELVEREVGEVNKLVAFSAALAFGVSRQNNPPPLLKVDMFPFRHQQFTNAENSPAELSESGSLQLNLCRLPSRCGWRNKTRDTALHPLNFNTLLKFGRLTGHQHPTVRHFQQKIACISQLKPNGLGDDRVEALTVCFEVCENLIR